MTAMPMFPLGTVLFPHAPLSLHVFEPRYRALVAECLGGGGEFGVVLIERGREVGGGDTRFGVGTVARIREADRFPDGRYLLHVVGTRRLRVGRWLPEESYPRAEIELLDDPAPGTDTAEVRARVARLIGEVNARRAAFVEGTPPPTEVHLADDLVQASFEAAATAGLGPLDAQRLLELDDPGTRLRTLAELLADEARVLERWRAGP